jgi:hypothetical protein
VTVLLAAKQNVDDSAEQVDVDQQQHHVPHLAARTLGVKITKIKKKQVKREIQKEKKRKENKKMLRLRRWKGARSRRRN